MLNEIDLRVKPVGKHGKQDYEEWVVHLLEDSKLIRHTAASRWFMGFAMYLRVSLCSVGFSKFCFVFEFYTFVYLPHLSFEKVGICYSRLSVIAGFPRNHDM